MTVPRSVDEYIAASPTVVQRMLQQLREIIRAAAPEAEERISYGMPYYYFGGRLAYFQAHSHHLGLYSFSLEDARAAGLEQYTSAKATLQFPFDQPLPTAGIHTLVENRVNSVKAMGGRTAPLGR
jgi:uncharacterized protein YdhG (YjbR/CyaY superfamily)